METGQVNVGEHHSELEEDVTKKSYVKPEIIYRGPLEAMAAVCTPTPPGKAPLSCGTTFS